MSNANKQMYLLLSKNRKSVLFLKPYKSDLSKSILNKLKKSEYEGDKKFYSLLITTEEEKGEREKEKEEDVPVVIKRVNEPSNITTASVQVWRPLMSMQADVGVFKFTNPSATDPSYVLTCVDLFTQMIFTYGFKTKDALPRAVEKFLKEIEKDRNFFIEHDPNNFKYLRLQTDEEFTMNNKIKKICKEHSVNLYTTFINGGHASAAEQKIKLLKERMTVYLQSNNFKKTNKGKALKDITENINSQIVEKYQFSPNKLIETFKKNPSEIANYNAYRLDKVKKAAVRRTRAINKKINLKKTRLRNLKVNDLVFIPKGRLKKQDYPGRLDKVTTNKKPFFANNITFKVFNIFKTENDTTLYQVRTVTKIPNLDYLTDQKFTRDELYALKDNTVSKAIYKKNGQ